MGFDSGFMMFSGDNRCRKWRVTVTILHDLRKIDVFRAAGAILNGYNHGYR